MATPLKEFLAYKILIVDDISTMRGELRSILINLGFSTIDEAQDGSEALVLALDKARFATPYDIIMSDINMPVMDGLTLLKNLRNTESYKNIPIFMLSTENEKGIIIKSILFGASDYIIKPYNPETIGAKLFGKLKV